MSASNGQIQNFVDSRIRVRAEQIRALYLAMKDDKAEIDDIYAALNVESPSWSDSRDDGPPHLLAASDVLAINAFYDAVIDAIDNQGQYAVVLKACVRPIGA
jgi:hypothetical protein